MDLEGIMLSEISQTENDKYCVISLICGIKKKTKYTKLVEKENRLVVTRGRGWGEGELEKGGQQVQTSRYKGKQVLGM